VCLCLSVCLGGVVKLVLVAGLILLVLFYVVGPTCYHSICCMLCATYRALYNTHTKDMHTYYMHIMMCFLIHTMY
jgi:hypothetical protein